TSHWSHGTPPPDTGQRQDIETPRKDHRTGEKEPASPHGLWCRPPTYHPGSRDEPQGVIHMIAYASLEHRQHFRRDPPTEQVRAEGPRGNGEQGGKGS